MDDAQLRMARAALKIDVRDLSAATGVAKNTISNFENQRHRPDDGTVTRLRGNLETFVIFVEAEEGEHGRGVLLRPGVGLGSWSADVAPKPEFTPEPVSEGARQVLVYWESRPLEWAVQSEGFRSTTLESVFGFVPDVDPILGDSARPAAE